MLKDNKTMFLTLKSVFNFIFLIDLGENKFKIIKANDEIKSALHDKNQVEVLFSLFKKGIAKKDYTEDMDEFLNLNTLTKRLSNKSSLSIEFESIKYGLCKARFIDVRDDYKLKRCLFAVELLEIDSQKQLKYYQQKLNHNKKLKQSLFDLQIRSQILESISKNYYLTGYVDFKHNTYKFTSQSNVLQNREYKGYFSDGLSDFIKRIVVESDQERMINFLDTKKLLNLLLDCNYISTEYQDINFGECRLEISVSKRGEKGIPIIAIFTSLIIEDEKKDKEKLSKVKKQLEKIKNAGKESDFKATHDALTGLTNRNGFENLILKNDYTNRVIGFMMIDIDNFKHINDNYGHILGDKLLICVGKMLSERFNQPNLVVRFGGDEFVVLILNEIDFKETILRRKIAEINADLLKGVEDIPPASISAGVVFSKQGYNDQLYQKADEALYEIKNNGKCGLKFSNDYLVSDYNTELQDNIINQKKCSWYNEPMYYEKSDNGILFNNMQKYIDKLLESNKAVGIVCGYVDDDLSIYAISHFTIRGIGYTYAEFNKTTNGSFLKLIYEDDRSSLIEELRNKTFLKRKIRLIDVEKKPVWYDMTLCSTYKTSNNKMWIASLRYIDDIFNSGLSLENSYLLVGYLNYINKQFIINKSLKYETNIMPKDIIKCSYYELINDYILKLAQPINREKYSTKLNIDIIYSSINQYGMFRQDIVISIGDKTMTIAYKALYFDKSENILIIILEKINS